MIPLASDLLPFPGQMRREDLLKSASLPDQLSSSGRIVILDSISQNCPELLGGVVDKTISRGKQATESVQQHGDGNASFAAAVLNAAGRAGSGPRFVQPSLRPYLRSGRNRRE